MAHFTVATATPGAPGWMPRAGAPDHSDAPIVQSFRAEPGDGLLAQAAEIWMWDKWDVGNPHLKIPWLSPHVPMEFQY